MINFTVSDSEFESDLMELVRLFEAVVDEPVSLSVDYAVCGDVLKVRTSSDKYKNFSKNYIFKLSGDELEIKRQKKRYLKIAVYRTLGFLTGVDLPYGCLTGIRPTKLYTEISNRQAAYGKSAHDVFLHDYGVHEDKLALIERICEVQAPLRNKSGQDVDLFVFIPFCPTRCAYCSFVSLPLSKQKKLVEPYVNCLIEELKQAKEIVKRSNLHIRSVYVGGGTPTSIGVDMLDKVLAECHTGATEFTVEAGRPDTIDKDIVHMMLSHGVNRISVNPQTFNDATLERIGRQHKAKDIYAAYALVKGKMAVNMDLIAMLPDETVEDFKRSVDICVALAPENITVHTLYMKKGSQLKTGGYSGGNFNDACAMVDYAYSKLTDGGYNPYYMYRQKYTSGNLENVGYARKGFECLYNIDIMEEDTSIVACGANAISKKWEADKNLITRCANYKEPLEYIKNIDLMLERQRTFWEGYKA